MHHSASAEPRQLVGSLVILCINYAFIIYLSSYSWLWGYFQLDMLRCFGL